MRTKSSVGKMQASGPTAYQIRRKNSNPDLGRRSATWADLARRVQESRTCLVAVQEDKSFLKIDAFNSLPEMYAFSIFQPNLKPLGSCLTKAADAISTIYHFVAFPIPEIAK